MNTNFKNKTILITGGTGSFGRSFVERIIKFGPKKIIIFSRDEQKHNEMMKNGNPPEPSKLRFYLGKTHVLTNPGCSLKVSKNAPKRRRNGIESIQEHAIACSQFFSRHSKVLLGFAQEGCARESL